MNAPQHETIDQVIGRVRGQDGVSPSVTVTDIAGGHRITIIDAAHPSGQTVDVMDGTDGTSPTITATAITGGYRITITDVQHPEGQSVDILHGAKGDKGDKGDTGNGIDHIALTSSQGVIDTYTVYYTNGDTWTYTVANSSEASADRIIYREEDPHPAGYLGNAVNDLQTALALVLTWITHTEADYGERIASLEGSRTSDEGRISTLESTATSHGTRLTAAEGNITGLTGRMGTAEGNITALGTRIGTAEGKITSLEGKMTTAEGNITKLTARTEIETGTVTLTNSQPFPFNDSQVTVPLVTERANQNYIVDYEVTAAVGNVGDIIVSAKLVNGFKIEHTGSATSVTVKYQVLGGMA